MHRIRQKHLTYELLRQRNRLVRLAIVRQNYSEHQEKIDIQSIQKARLRISYTTLLL